MGKPIKYAGEIWGTDTSPDDIVNNIDFTLKHSVLGHAYPLRIDNKDFLTSVFKEANGGGSIRPRRYPSMRRWEIEIIFTPK